MKSPAASVDLLAPHRHRSRHGALPNLTFSQVETQDDTQQADRQETANMSSASRWAAADPEEELAIAQRKREKEAKKRAKAERQRFEERRKAEQKAAGQPVDSRPVKKRRLSNETGTGTATATATTDASVSASASPVDNARNDQNDNGRKILRFPSAEWCPCRHVDNYERLNHIEEGSYGLVSRAKDLVTGEIVALKKLKIDNAPDGFPVTGLREIQTLQRARHVNIVHLREIVMGNSMQECVYSPLPPPLSI